MEIADYIVAEDRELVDRVLKGDNDAFEYLFNRYRDAIHRLFVQRLGGVNDADDLLQETFIKVYINLHRYSADYTFGQWVYTIARNTFIDFVRRCQDDLPIDERFAAPASNAPTPEESVINLQQRSQIEHYLEHLAPRYRQLILMRFFEVNSGRITIDGVATTDLRREDVHELFGMVLQDTWLFEGTIRENLVYNMEGITDEQLETVCKACGLDKFVHSLPQGFDTVLSESTTISAGQKQLLTIARAMLQNAPMLILDEATSSVDTRTELLIQRAMDELTKGRTSFVIAHRLSTIKNADLILVMRDGDVIESGTHEQLMEQNGFYAELYNSQFTQAS